MVRGLDGQAEVPAWLWFTDRDRRSGCGGEAGSGDVAGDELIEGVERRGEFGGRVGPVRCHQRPEDVVVDPGVEAGEQQPVAGQGVAVAVRDALDEAVAGQ